MMFNLLYDKLDADNNCLFYSTPDRLKPTSTSKKRAINAGSNEARVFNSAYQQASSAARNNY